MREISQGTVIYSAGQRIDSFYLIRKGAVVVAYPGGKYVLQSGDVIGLCEMGSGVSGMEYRAGEGLEVLVYPYGAAQMKRLFESSSDVVKFFSSSFFRQFNEILARYRALKEECAGLYGYLKNSYDTYLSLCEKYNLTPKKIKGFEDLAQPSTREEIPLWISGYYSTLEQMIAIWDYNKTDYDFMYGFMLKSSSDIRTILSLSQKMYRYQEDGCRYMMNGESAGLVELMFDLSKNMMYRKATAEDSLLARGSLDEMIQHLHQFGYDTDPKKKEIVEGIRAVEEDIANGGTMPEEKAQPEAVEEPSAETMTETEGTPADAAEPLAEKEPEAATEVLEGTPGIEEEIPAAVEASPAEEIQQSEELPEEFPEELEDSISQILDFAGCEKELSESFKAHIERYKKMPNKNGTEDDIRVLRQEITKEFNRIYCDAFLNNIATEQPKELPAAVKMFFTFGYVDEKLAGEKNAIYLYHTVDHLPTNPEKGVYSIYEWLKEVYAERKEPCRNEFDTDYAGYLQEQKRMGNITAEEQKELLTNRKEKVRFELENMFPVVNKVTFGRLTTFCPVFSEHNIMKPLDSMIVRTEKIMEVLEDIRGKDYGAYYRETLYTNPQQGIPKEVIHVEVLPDFILMPNAGIRGVMWQEIEGKRRNTPARMMLSIFQMEDLASILIRLTGEFRWEMCKRVQGARWNDLTEKSLTSEYFDYIQFYRKNPDLSTETKEKIKTDLGRTKNSFKEMFLKDYALWIMFESNSSPRLNKVVRAIFFTYCTFTAPVRQRLRANPLYQELADRCEIKMKQKRHKIENICQKLRSQGKDIPEEIQKEMEYMTM